MLKDLFLSNPFANSRYLSKSLLELPLPDSESESKGLIRTISYERTQKPVTLTRVTKADPMLNLDPLDANRSHSLPRRTNPQEVVTQKLSGESFRGDLLNPINVLVAGGSKVGKSALTVRFITKRYIGEYMSGEKQNYTYLYPEEGGRQQRVNFQDEISHEDALQCLALQLSDENLSWADAVIMVYDVGEPISFNYVKDGIQIIDKKQSLDGSKDCCGYKPVLVLGNKKDVIRRRRIHDDDIKEAAKKFPHWVGCGQVSAAEEYEAISHHVDQLVARVRYKRQVLSSVSPKENIKSAIETVFKRRSIKSKRELDRSHSIGRCKSCQS